MLGPGNFFSISFVLMAAAYIFAVASRKTRLLNEMTCFSRSKVEWVSGLNHQFAKLTYWKRYPGFESRLHRQAHTHTFTPTPTHYFRGVAQSGSASRWNREDPRFKSWCFYKYRNKIRGVAQSGSAPALGAGGPRFKSWCLDNLEIKELRRKL